MFLNRDNYNNIINKLRKGVILSLKEHRILDYLVQASELSPFEQKLKNEIVEIKDRELYKVHYNERKRIEGISGQVKWIPTDEWTSSELRWYDSSETDWKTGESQDYITLNGSKVSNWEDRTGSGSDAYQSVSSSQPLIGYSNGFFDRFLDYGVPPTLILPNFISGSEDRLVVVAASGAFFSSNRQVELSGDSSTVRFGCWTAADAGASANMQIAVNSTVGFSYHNASLYKKRPYIMSWGLEGDRSINCFTRLNGNQNNLSSGDVAVNTGTANGQIKPYYCDFAELIIVKGTTTTEQREKIEGYLAHKYNCADNLKTGHPYKDSFPLV